MNGRNMLMMSSKWYLWLNMNPKMCLKNRRRLDTTVYSAFLIGFSWFSKINSSASELVPSRLIYAPAPPYIIMTSPCSNGADGALLSCSNLGLTLNYLSFGSVFLDLTSWKCFSLISFILFSSWYDSISRYVFSLSLPTRSLYSRNFNKALISSIVAIRGSARSFKISKKNSMKS